MNRPPVYVSGPWEIDLGRREMRMHGVPVAIGQRAFYAIDILVQEAGNEVSKHELIHRIWPDRTGTENTLQVHIAAARKALGPYRDLLQTVSGRGYRLRGTWTIPTDAAVGPPAGGLGRSYGSHPGLPLPTSDLIGRADSIRAIRDRLGQFRIVTLAGPGGIGKSRLALEVGRDLLTSFENGVWLVDLAAVSDPAFVAFTISNVLGLALRENEVTSAAIARAIGGQKLLLVLDTCEHVVEATARITETIIQLCPHVSALTTSREPLLCDREHVYRVPPLEVPPPAPPGVAELLTYSAAKLLVTRIASVQYGFSPTDEDMLAIASVCRRLDGIPLAIELAASRAATLGLQHVAARLNDALGMLTGGYRTAVPQHQTLRATLDWSYNLLLDHERVVLRRIAVFRNGFTLEAAEAVAATNGIDASIVVEAIGNVVLKSLLSIETGANATIYRLHDTTKA